MPAGRLRRIVLAYAANRLGDWFGFVALSVAVYDHTGSGIAVAALLVAWQVLPALVVPALVARVEASERRRELTALYCFEALCTGLLAVLVLEFTLPALLVVAALDGMAGLAARALLRTEAARAARRDFEERVPRGTLGAEAFEQGAQRAEHRANATLNVVFSTAFMLGPAIAGAIVAAAGAPAALAIDAALFLVTGSLLLDFHPHVEEAAGASVRSLLRAALGHINEVPGLRAVLICEAFALVFFSAGGPIEVAFAKSTLGAGDRGYGFLLAAWGVGAVLGSAVFARSPRRGPGTLLTAGTLAVGLGYLGFAASPTLLAACLSAVLGGVGNGVQWAALIATVQTLTPESLRGRMMGACESIGSLCPALGLSLGGALIAAGDPRSAFVVAGAGAVLASGAFLALTLGGLRPSVAASAGPPAAPVPEGSRAEPGDRPWAPGERLRALSVAVAGQPAPEVPLERELHL